MDMMRFASFIPRLGAIETRVVALPEPVMEDGRVLLPADEYAFDELYCATVGCDCRQVLINVLARHARQHLAAITHLFDKPESPFTRQTYLDPAHHQSPAASILLDLFLNTMLSDKDYRDRLERHYHQFKSVVNNPAHPKQSLLTLHPAALNDFLSRTPATPPKPEVKKRR